jgi:hypothetical protein
VQVEKPNLDIRFDEETSFTWSLVWKCEAERLDAAGGLESFNFHLSTTNTNIVISERAVIRDDSGECTHVTNFLRMCNCDPNNLMKRDPCSGSSVVVVVVQLVC